MHLNQHKFLISIIGPTAIGKTNMAIQLARHFDTEIISADSRQFFKELNIGTAKPTIEEQNQAKHYFIDNKSITEDYNANDFEKEALEFLSEYFKKKNLILLCGGSGLYIDALLHGFDEGIPDADPAIRKELEERLNTEGIESLQNQLKQLDPIFYKEIDLSNSKRLMRAIEVCLLSDKPYSEIRRGKKVLRPFHTLKVGLQMPREQLYTRINQRVDQMLSSGLLEEVKSVISYKNHNALKTVGYRELFDHFDGILSLEQAKEKIKVNSRRYAKRQITWFKRDPEIEWFPTNEKAQIIEYIRKRISSE